MSCELELKYSLSNSNAADVFQHPCIAPLLSGNIAHIFMESTYFDTPDGILKQNKSALRIRKENSVPIVTLKTEQVANGAFSRRGEWEVSSSCIEEALPLLSQEGAPQFLLENITSSPLSIIAQFSFMRSQAIIQCNTFSAQLCVDIGDLSPDGVHKTPLREVELELISGDLQALCAKGEELRTAFSMQAQPLSKLCRACGFKKKLECL